MNRLLLLFAAFLFTLTTNAQVVDIDGNVYDTVQIGTQTWMVENLRTTRYNDSTEIPLVSDTSWYTLGSAAYCWYDNDISNKDVYGALYNWYAVSNEKLCPAGWHIPTDAEWKTLIINLGGDTIAGAELKEPGTEHWDDPNIGADNNSGFTGLPGGGRWKVGRFNYKGERGYWWSTSEYDNYYDGTVWLLSYKDRSLNRLPSVNESGFSVRCIKGSPLRKGNIHVIKIKR